jgi:uncharacterized protein YdhG (YjbR/CyaY superfamily)
MAKTDFQSVDEYISTFPDDAQRVLRQVRQTIRRAVPRGEELISYQIPAYRLPDGPALYFAGWKKHYSLYPATAAILDALARELEPYEVRKGTIRFPLSAPVPVKLIARIAKLRAQETRERAEKKGASAKPPAAGPAVAKKSRSKRHPLKKRAASKGAAAKKPSVSAGGPGKKKSRLAKKRLPRAKKRLPRKKA